MADRMGETDQPGDSERLDDVVRYHVARVYEAYGRNKTKAAIALGVDRKTLQRHLARMGAGAPRGGEHVE